MSNMPIFFLLHQWKDAKPDDLMDSKLRCVFELPSENDKVVSEKCHYGSYKTLYAAQFSSHFFTSLNCNVSSHLLV